MVDVTEKEVTSRTAVARGFVVMNRRVVEAIRRLQQGEVASERAEAAKGNARFQIQDSRGRGRSTGAGEVENKAAASLPHSKRGASSAPSSAGQAPFASAQGRLGPAPALRKGNPLEVARVAGIAAAKRTAELIPMCHPLPLTHIDVTATLCKNGVELRSRVTATARTGVEMEALAAVTVAALTVYDMCKALDKEMEITGVHLVEKIGGRSGHYARGAQDEGMALPRRGKKSAGRMPAVRKARR